MDENILLNSLYKFANLGFYKHGWELPQLVKNARFLYRDYLTSEHIQLLTGFYNDFAKGHFSNTNINASATSAEAEGGELIETEGEQLHF